MKKIYILSILLSQAILSMGQFNPGFFEFRLTLPGDEPGIFRVQARAVSSVVPTSDDFCTDIALKMWWSFEDTAVIKDIDVDQATVIGGNWFEENPVLGSPSGSGSPTGKVVALSAGSDPFQFPSSWTLNQWVNICNVKICSNNNCNPAGAPSGITAADFLIQGFVTNTPNFGVQGESYTPSNGPLPLNLIAFNAYKSGDRNAHITWTTANEENTSHFTVQRSYDLKTWTDVGNTGAAGYSVDIRNYELMDLEVYNGRDSRLQVYYRLVMVDLDGRSKLSPVKSVIFGNSSLASRGFLVYPNPASNGVHVEWEAEEFNQPTALEFYDIHGKLILTQQVAEKSTQEYVDFTKTTILPGLYLLRVMNGDEPIEYKQIVVSQR